MWQDEIVIDLKEYQLLAQAVFVLTGRGATPPYRRHALTQAQIQPLHKRRVDLPATRGQDLLHRHFRAAYDTVFDLNDAPASHPFDHLRIE
jgi:hypothetical protein